MPFDFEILTIPDVILVKPKVFCDDRGFLMERYRESDFRENDIYRHVVRENHWKSIKNDLR